MTTIRLPPPPSEAIVTDRWTAPFWAALARRRLVVAACGKCGTTRMPPTPFCPECQSQDIDWRDLPGGGVLYSYTIVVRAVIPGMDDYLPYAPAVVELDGGGGARLIANLAGCTADDLAVGMRLALCWRDDAPQPLPYFVPAITSDRVLLVAPTGE